MFSEEFRLAVILSVTIVFTIIVFAGMLRDYIPNVKYNNYAKDLKDMQVLLLVELTAIEASVNDGKNIKDFNVDYIYKLYHSEFILFLNFLCYHKKLSLTHDKEKCNIMQIDNYISYMYKEKVMKNGLTIEEIFKIEHV